MALQIIEFFGFSPLDESKVAKSCIKNKHCPFVDNNCIKPNHGTCSVRQVKQPEPIICCPNRLYANEFKVLQDISDQVFGEGTKLIKPSEIKRNSLSGNEVAVFGRYWDKELPLPRPQHSTDGGTHNYYVDWILAKLNNKAELVEFTAVEVQTIDTTGNYKDQVANFLSGKKFTDSIGRTPGFSDAGMNWENVNKRILPQIIYKGHVLRRESKCSKGMFFVCSKQVYEKIKERLGRNLHNYQPGNGTVTFVSYKLGETGFPGFSRDLILTEQFTTTVDQIALAFTSPMNLPTQNVYEAAILKALK